MTKIVEVRFEIASEPSVTERVRTVILNRYSAVSPTKVNKLWRGNVPNREAITVDVGGNVVSLMDDWQCTVFGHSYVKCLTALIAIQDVLRRDMGLRASFDFFEPSEELDSLIRQQGRTELLIKGSWLLIGAVLGAVISRLLNLGF